MAEWTPKKDQRVEFMYRNTLPERFKKYDGAEGVILNNNKNEDVSILLDNGNKIDVPIYCILNKSI